MLSFDLTVFVIQTGLFILFLIFCSRFIIKPVQKMLEKRKEILNKENKHAISSQSTSRELKEQYRQQIELSHKSGIKIITSRKAEALAEMSLFMTEEREKTILFAERKRGEIIKSSESLKKEMITMRDEFVSLITKKLWRVK